MSIRERHLRKNDGGLMHISHALRIVYFGTPEFAVPALTRLAGDPRFSVALVVTQPDRPSGRGRKLTPPPVKTVAQGLGLPVYQPESLRSDELRQPINVASADCFVVAAYGKIFGRRMLEMAPLGCLNLHASLLPRYRGASPVPAAILCGDQQTGVTLMKMETGLDTGPMLDTAELHITAEDTSERLLDRLSHLAADLAARGIVRYATGETRPRPQPAEGASIVRPLLKADGWLDWSRPAAALERRVRAMWPWPRAWTTVDGQPLQVHAAHVESGQPVDVPGTVVQYAGQCAVACVSSYLVLDIVQPAGARAMPGDALLAGRRVAAGDRLGLTGGPPSPPPLIEWLDAEGHRAATGCQP
jgi:methionyl-tRNA formyltransferase